MNKPRKQRIWPLARRRAETAMARYEEIVRGNRGDPFDPKGWDTFAAVGWDTTGEAQWEPGETFHEVYGRPPTDAEQLAIDPLFDALQEKLKGEWLATHGLTADQDVEPCHECQQPMMYVDERWWHMARPAASCFAGRNEGNIVTGERPYVLGFAAFTAACRVTGAQMVNEDAAHALAWNVAPRNPGGNGPDGDRYDEFSINDNRCARLTSSEQHEQFMAAMYPGDDPGDDPGEPQRIEPPSWDHPRITDWRYEVANGDTMRGFADWLANEDEPELGDQRLTDSHMRWEAEEGEPVAGHDDEYSVELVEPPGA